MSNNLIVSYDLNNPGQSYDRVITAVKALGAWAHIQKSLWYVKSSYTAQQARDYIAKAADKNDSIIVVNASDNDAAWVGVAENVSVFLKEQWGRGSGARYAFR